MQRITVRDCGSAAGVIYAVERLFAIGHLKTVLVVHLQLGELGHLTEVKCPAADAFIFGGKLW